MADDTTDIAPFQEPSSAKWLQLIGSILGGNRGHLVGGALMGLGSMMDQNAYSKWEQATRPKELAMFQKHLNLSPDEMSYFGGLPTEMYQQLRPQLYNRLLAKPQGEGTPVKVSDNGVEGMYFPASGRTQWLSKGEDFYQPPQKTAQSRPLTQEQLGVASSAGLPSDTSKWGPPEWSRYMKANAAYQQSKQRAPQIPEILMTGTDASGNPVVAGVERPRGGGTPTVTKPVPLGFAPGRPTAAKGGHENQFDYFVRTHPDIKPGDMISAYHAATRESEDQKLKAIQQRLQLETDAANRRGDAATARRLQNLRDEVAEGLKAPPETREQKYQDFQKRLGDLEASAERRGDHAAATRLRNMQQEVEMGLRAKPGGKGGSSAFFKGSNEDFQGYKYNVVSAKDNPSYGVGGLNQSQGTFSRMAYGPMPRVIWKVGGVKVNPAALNPQQRAKYAEMLMRHGFTMDQLTGGGLSQ